MYLHVVEDSVVTSVVTTDVAVVIVVVVGVVVVVVVGVFLRQYTYIVGKYKMYLYEL